MIKESQLSYGRSKEHSRSLFGAVCFALMISAPSSLVFLSRPASASVGCLSQLPGLSGCISEDGSGGECTDGAALDGPNSVTISWDGTSVYVTSAFTDAIAIFDRDVETGALIQKSGTAGCISETGTGGMCADGKALDGPNGVLVSPDDSTVYVASAFSSAVAIFDRDIATGELTQKEGPSGCISETGTGGDCTDGRALAGAFGLAVSSDGGNIYVTSTSSDAVAIFDRDSATGELTQKAGLSGCISDTGNGGECRDGTALDGPTGVTASSDGTNIYVTSLWSGSVTIFDRDTTTGELAQRMGLSGCISETGSGGDCIDGRALDGAVGAAVSSDGLTLYVVSEFSDAISIFSRDLTTGNLVQKPGLAGCISETGSGGECTDGKALAGAFSVAVNPQGHAVYVASELSDAVALFNRDLVTGDLEQKFGVAGCISETGSGGECTDGKALDAADGAVVSPDGNTVYVASEFSDAVAAFVVGVFSDGFELGDTSGWSDTAP